MYFSCIFLYIHVACLPPRSFTKSQLRFKPPEPDSPASCRTSRRCTKVPFGIPVPRRRADCDSTHPTPTLSRRPIVNSP
jgi:hypothetical protein